MKRALLAVLAAALTLAACSGGSDAVDQNPNSTFKFTSGTKLGDLYPKADRKPTKGFTAKLLDGAAFNLSSTRGKVVVLNFWASWCAPCRTETPQFDLLYREIKSKGVDFVGIDTKDDKGSAESFINNYNITYPIVYDEQGATALQLGNLPAAALPFTVLLDQAGRVATVYVVRLSAKDLQNAIDKLFAGQ
jgi:peroxiredoxin